MSHDYNLKRFLDAQNQMYFTALSEIKNGRKTSHWMWYIFPQLNGLGHSETAKFYGIMDLKEAQAYLEHPVLGKHLIEITTAVLQISGKTAVEIFGTPDYMKFHSCMTLFAKLEKSNPVFGLALKRFYAGCHDEITLEILRKQDLMNTHHKPKIWL